VQVVASAELYTGSSPSSPCIETKDWGPHNCCARVTTTGVLSGRIVQTAACSLPP